MLSADWVFCSLTSCYIVHCSPVYQVEHYGKVRRGWFKFGFGNFILHCYQVRPHSSALRWWVHKGQISTVRRWGISCSIYYVFLSQYRTTVGAYLNVTDSRKPGAAQHSRLNTRWCRDRHMCTTTDRNWTITISMRQIRNVTSFHRDQMASLRLSLTCLWKLTSWILQHMWVVLCSTDCFHVVLCSTDCFHVVLCSTDCFHVVLCSTDCFHVVLCSTDCFHVDLRPMQPRKIAWRQAVECYLAGVRTATAFIPRQ